MTKQTGQKEEDQGKIKLSLDMDKALYNSFISTIQEREGLPIDPDDHLPRGLRSKILKQAIAQWISRGDDEPIRGKTQTERSLILLKNELKKRPHQLSLGEIKKMSREILGVHDKRTIDKYVRLMGEQNLIHHVGFDPHGVKTIFSNMVPYEAETED